MQNAVTMLFAIVGVFVGGWLALYLFYQNGEADAGVTALLGAIPGTVAGAWIGVKITGWRA